MLATNVMVLQLMKSAIKMVFKSAPLVLMHVKMKYVFTVDKKWFSNDASKVMHVKTTSFKTQDLHGFQVNVMDKLRMMYADAAVKDIFAILQNDLVLLKKNAIWLR